VSKSSAVQFPPGFLWGTATASYQIEGAVNEDDRGVSIWDTFSHTPGRVHHGDTGDVACDHYHRWREDVGLIEQLGIGAYRFSVAWPRVQPTGKGPANQAGLDFYRRLVDALADIGVTPAATLYHWDLPQPLEDAGGWRVRDTAERFAEYSALVADELGDRVGMWITLNEPWCSSWLGYGIGQHAPGDRDLAAALNANHHLLLGHGLAVDAIRSASKSPVGITLNLANVRPTTDDPADQSAAELVDGNHNRLFLDPLFRGRYPADMIKHYAPHGAGSALQAGDLEIISKPIDFLGVNFYFPTIISHASRLDAARAAGYLVEATEAPSLYAADLGITSVGRPGVERTSSGWEIEADALRELLIRVRHEYTDLPLYVTENGAATEDYVTPDGEVHDPERIDYIDGHLRAVHQAMDAGVNVRGYFVWSLMDNFEWARGYAKRFGLTWVDFGTGQRTPKQSYHWYRELVKANGLGDLS
jgi:beta-glucosidase